MTKEEIDYNKINNLIAKLNNNFHKTFMYDEIKKLQSINSNGEISSVNINEMIKNIEFMIADGLLDVYFNKIEKQEEGNDSDYDMVKILEEIRTIFLQTIQSEMDALIIKN